MKRHAKLFEQVVAWPNLLEAARKARLRKRYRDDVLEFQFDLENHLDTLYRELATDSFVPGGYFSFEVRDPKRRLISAAPYRDRVVHHAICNLVEPILDRTFIYDNYACRKGKGQASALRRAYSFARKYTYVLKTDFAKYFPSIDHAILKAKLRGRLKDYRLLNLIDQIIDLPFPGQRRPTFFPGDDLISNSERRCGLPIGNQTSQLFGNFYLNEIDHFIKEDLRSPGYVRYMDDLALFANDKRELWQMLDAVRSHCNVARLRLHARKTSLAPTRNGFRFLGFHVSSGKLVPFPETVVRFRRRLCQLQAGHDRGEIDLQSLHHSVCAYWGHFDIAGTPNRFRKILADFPFFQKLMAEAKERNQSRTAQEIRRN